MVETERLGDDGGGSAGVELVGEPCAVEGVGGRFGASTVDEERSIERRGEREGKDQEKGGEREEEGGRQGHCWNSDL